MFVKRFNRRSMYVETFNVCIDVQCMYIRLMYNIQYLYILNIYIHIFNYIRQSCFPIIMSLTHFMGIKYRR